MWTECLGSWTAIFQQRVLANEYHVLGEIQCRLVPIEVLPLVLTNQERLLVCGYT